MEQEGKKGREEVWQIVREKRMNERNGGRDGGRKNKKGKEIKKR